MRTAGKAVQFRDHDRITHRGAIKERRKLGAMFEGSPGQLFLENFLAAVGGELRDLRVQVLGGGTHPGIAVNHGIRIPFAL